jgi:hypothetical protein
MILIGEQPGDQEDVVTAPLRHSSSICYMLSAISYCLQAAESVGRALIEH